LQLLRSHFDTVKKQLHKKDPTFDVQLLFDLDHEVRQLRCEIEMLRSKRNQLAQQAKSGLTQEIRQESIALGQMIKEKEEHLSVLEKQFLTLYSTVPNIPYDDVPVGGKESNKVVKEFGEKKIFNFALRNHVELAEKLGWIDFHAAASIAGSNFALYKKDAVKLIYALGMFMLKNNMQQGYEPIFPPFLVNEKSLEVAGNFPKFKDQVYAAPADDLYLIPTSEVSLVNMYRNHIFSSVELPLSMTAFTSCFRREAGSYGAAERGLIRIHQFEKVELVTICEPQHSSCELDRMIACAESILQKLGLHYRISLLAAQDCSFQSAKTYDIEVWLPAQGIYSEVSSASNCTDFQSRRGLIRYKEATESHTRLVHTLNASSLALPRLMVALMETYQQEDGSIALPDVLLKEGLFS